MTATSHFMSTFYHVTNCNRTIRAGALSFNFVPYEHTGCWLGVYEATDPAEIAALDGLVADKKSGVTAITQNEYHDALKKKKQASQGYSNSLASSAPNPSESAAAPSVGQPVDTNPSPAPVETVAPLSSVSEAIPVVKVESKKSKTK